MRVRPAETLRATHQPGGQIYHLRRDNWGQRRVIFTAAERPFCLGYSHLYPHRSCSNKLTALIKENKKLIRRWDSECELSLRRHRARDTKYNRLLHKFRHRSTRRLCVGTFVVVPSVRLSVCLSVCLSSVTFVHPTQPIEIFGSVSVPFNTLVTWRHPGKIWRRSSQGNPSVGGGGLNQRVVEKM